MASQDRRFFFLPAAGVDDFAVVSGAVGDVAEERHVHRLQKTENGKRKTENRKQKTENNYVLNLYIMRIFVQLACMWFHVSYDCVREQAQEREDVTGTHKNKQKQIDSFVLHARWRGIRHMTSPALPQGSREPSP
jgi:hypothetical protein